MRNMRSRIVAALSLALAMAGAQAATFDLAGPDGTGFLSLSNVKGWATEAEAAAGSLFPYFQRSNGSWTSIAAVPLSASSIYAEEASHTVLNKSLTQADFSTFSAGSISYDASALSGVGAETIGAAALTLTVNGAGFSPMFSPYNTGGGYGNFGWTYVITASNVSGGGLSFNNGQLVGVDLDADISVAVRYADNALLTWQSTYDGTLSISGNQYAFDIDVTQANGTQYFGGILPDTRLVMNRAGSIVAVVPEPGTYALMAGGLLLVGAVARRRRG